jgi:hypothetical protein
MTDEDKDKEFDGIKDIKESSEEDEDSFFRETADKNSRRSGESQATENKLKSNS